MVSVSMLIPTLCLSWSCSVVLHVWPHRYVLLKTLSSLWFSWFSDLISKYLAKMKWLIKPKVYGVFSCHSTFVFICSHLKERVGSYNVKTTVMIICKTKISIQREHFFGILCVFCQGQTYPNILAACNIVSQNNVWFLLNTRGCTITTNSIACSWLWHHVKSSLSLWYLDLLTCWILLSLCCCDYFARKLNLNMMNNKHEVAG